MPYTPFHLGPGLLLKAAAPRQFSFVAFAATQVAIDLESWYYLTRGVVPVHRLLHTFVFASLLGVAVGALVWLLAHGVRRLLGTRAAHLSIGTPLAAFGGEVRLTGVTLGGLLGGLSHALLDSLMHRDIQPLRPLASGNPFEGLVSWDRLHLGCVAAGVLGLLWLAVNRRVWRTTT